MRQSHRWNILNIKKKTGDNITEMPEKSFRSSIQKVQKQDRGFT